jgi:hypothetical protein
MGNKSRFRPRTKSEINANIPAPGWKRRRDLVSAQQPKSLLSTFRGVAPPSAVAMRRNKGVRPVWFRPFHDSSNLGPYVRAGEVAAAL